MDRRVFLGWDRPLLAAVADWLWERRDELPELRVVVPTAQAGRRLREALAERGACLAPRFVTPGYFLRTPEAAPTAAEGVAWVETLEGVTDWERFQTVFPVPPGAEEGEGWALPLATSLVDLEKSLQENAQTPESAARRLSGTVDGERWRELSELWRRKEKTLRQWGLRGRSRLVEALAATGVEERIVLAGVPDLPEVVVRRLEGADFQCLIGAPEGEAFDDFGRPALEAWKDRTLDWPGSVEVTADPRAQAAAAVGRVALAGTASDALALGSADEETAEELVRAFGRAGWLVHNPAGGGVSAARGWISLWRAWLARPEAAAAVDLLGAAPCGSLVGGRRLRRLREISRLRDEGLARTRGDVARLEEMEIARRAAADAAGSGVAGLAPAEDGRLASETLERLEGVRGAFLRQPFGEAMERLLERVDPAGEWGEARDWLEAMAPVIGRVRRDAGFWLDLLAADLSEARRGVPDERVADVQGWLELLHEPGPHLVVCGMNEGRVPSSPGTDPWLSEGARGLLGMGTDARRAARDAYLFEAITRCRRESGRVDVLLAKSSADGDALLPSRLLLAARGEELARRVGVLFAEVEPPDAGMKWVADWKWRMPEVEVKPRLSVTALSDYLACPLRFHLKHVVGMRAREPERVEWNARDFGNVIHTVLERWGADPEARDFSRTEALEEWLHAGLERVVAERFDGEPPLAVRIQAAGARRRLSWFARWQACQRAEGWRVEKIEEKFVREIDGVELVGKVDRIDAHADGRRRVLDYKTHSKLEKVEGKHRTRIIASTVMPEHLDGVEAVIGADAKGKPARWTNLQVPLYSVFFAPVDELGYFVLGASEGETGLALWDGFSQADADSALRCAEWVIGRVKAGVFGPPAERVKYDDYELLAMKRGLAEVVVE